MDNPFEPFGISEITKESLQRSAANLSALERYMLDSKGYEATAIEHIREARLLLLEEAEGGNWLTDSGYNDSLCG